MFDMVLLERDPPESNFAGCLHFMHSTFVFFLTFGEAYSSIPSVPTQGLLNDARKSASKLMSKLFCTADW